MRTMTGILSGERRRNAISLFTILLNFLLVTVSGSHPAHSREHETGPLGTQHHPELEHHLASAIPHRASHPDHPRDISLEALHSAIESIAPHLHGHPQGHRTLEVTENSIRPQENHHSHSASGFHHRTPAVDVPPPPRSEEAHLNRDLNQEVEQQLPEQGMRSLEIDLPSFKLPHDLRLTENGEIRPSQEEELLSRLPMLEKYGPGLVLYDDYVMQGDDPTAIEQNNSPLVPGSNHNQPEDQDHVLNDTPAENIEEDPLARAALMIASRLQEVQREHEIRQQQNDAMSDVRGDVIQDIRDAIRHEGEERTELPVGVVREEEQPRLLVTPDTLSIPLMPTHHHQPPLGSNEDFNGVIGGGSNGMPPSAIPGSGENEDNQPTASTLQRQAFRAWLRTRGLVPSLNKRRPGCLRKCIVQGYLHPAQCHSLC